MDNRNEEEEEERERIAVALNQLCEGYSQLVRVIYDSSLADNIDLITLGSLFSVVLNDFSVRVGEMYGVPFMSIPMGEHWDMQDEAAQKAENN